MRKKLTSESRILLGVTLAVLVVVVVGAFFAPARMDTDQTPSTYNSGAHGAKAAWLLLGRLGYRTARWENSAHDLSNVDAAHTTLILADAYNFNPLDDKPALADFLKRGGHVLATGASSAAMLPESHFAPPNHIYTALCYTTPQGLSPLARAGSIATSVPVRWDFAQPDSGSPAPRIDQACGEDAVVVHYSVGKGDVVWWASSDPLSNRGLKQDSSLKLLLASTGDAKNLVLFDEYIHGDRQDLWETAAGTPVTALGCQLAAVAVLLVLSFGRRNGPLRATVQLPRSSPLEFAESMGDLYRKAGAVSVATDSAERRLLHFLETEGGVPRETLRSSPENIAAAVVQRFGHAAPGFAFDLEAAQQAESNRLSPRSALELIRRIDRHIANLTAMMRRSKPLQTNSEKTEVEPRD